MKYGRYEIRNVKHQKTKRGDTECFSLDFYVDGEKLAHVSNDGNQGMHDIEFAPWKSTPDIRDEEEIIRSDSLLTHHPFETFDSAVLTMLDLHVAAERIRRAMDGRIGYVYEGELKTHGAKSRREPSPETIEAFERQDSDVKVLNGFDIEQAAHLLVMEERYWAEVREDQDMGYAHR